MLPKEFRLPLRTEWHRLKKEGQAFQARGFTLIVGQARQDSSTRFAFIVSKKIDNRAVVRNRAKRLLSEAVLSLLPQIKSGQEIVVLAKRNIVEMNLGQIKEELNKIISEKINP